MKLKIVLFFLSVAVLTGCNALSLRPGNFAWPVELVLKVDDKGMIGDTRYSFAVNVKKLLFAETKDSVNVAGKEIRMIRDDLGYYFVTADKFKNIYVYEQSEGELRLADKISVSQEGLSSPAFNQRVPYIELVTGQRKPVLLTKDGIVEEKGGQEQ